ncbi:MAG TPA: iron-containing redox enzyme family protein [bacterium]|jgi:pyrroloquinoline-quinone synthase
MNIGDQLNETVENWNLLNHPFYQSWNEGKLSVDDIALYASEYGGFISILSEGWSSLGETEYAREEDEHVILWQKFAGAVNTKIKPTSIEKVNELIGTARNLFTDKPSSIGAMYAFEIQQPGTASTKLEALRKFYSLDPETSEEYFYEHCHNEHESDLLLEMTEDLSVDEKVACIDACAEMSEALWDALTGIQEKCSLS